MLKKRFKKSCGCLVFIFLSMIHVQSFADANVDNMYFLAGTGFMVAGGVVAYALSHHSSDVQKEYLLRPTGPYAVGFQDFRLVNGTLVNGSYSCPGKTDLLYIKGENESSYGKDNQVDFCREIMLRAYYPVQTRTLPREKYYVPFISSVQEFFRTAHIPGITEYMIDDLANIKTFSMNFTNMNSRIVDKQFPVLIFDPGCGEETQQYENIIEEMVSNGYIVLGINNTFIGSAILFPDGRIVLDQNQESPVSIRDLSVLNDILFVRQLLDTTKTNDLSPLIAHMDLNHVGLFGHSMGGISVVKTIRDDSSMFQAAISLDAPPIVFGVRNYSEQELAGFPNTPFMRLFAAEWRTLAGLNIPKNAKFELFKDNYYTLLSPNEDNNTYTGHMNFSDYSTLQYQPLFRLVIPIDADDVGTANGWRIATLMDKYILGFFNKYLKGIPNPLLEKCQAFSEDSMLTCGIK